MQMVILAAGRGTRMRELTDYMPKPMLEINGEPILAHKIKALPQEIDEVILVVGYLGEKIRAYFGTDYAGKKISYVEQKELNGSGGAVQSAEKILKDDFLVMNGDDLYMKNDIKELAKYDLAMLVAEIEDPSKFGLVSVDEDGKLLGITERQQVSGLGLVNAGVYKLNRKFFEYSLISIGNGEFGLPQTMVKMTDKYEVKVQKASDWFAIGTPEDLAKAIDAIVKFI